MRFKEQQATIIDLHIAFIQSAMIFGTKIARIPHGLNEFIEDVRMHYNPKL